jgi:two-component sensor histidine kinase
MAALEPDRFDLTHNLGLAVVASSVAPLLLMKADRTILAASMSFLTTFQIKADSVVGRRIETLGEGEWDIPQLRSLLAATLSGDARIDAYEMDLVKPGQAPRRLSLNAQRLDYFGAGVDDGWLVLTICDVTDVRLREQLREALSRDNALLLQEVRHRVANSLQIIASVLMQNARRVTSDEARGHLRDAHQRVIAIAELERQLAVSGFEQVELQGYFGKLCDSLRASMISPAGEISLKVTGDVAVVPAGVSISLGLIVTELVINALKHAFPNRSGAIVVDYQSMDADWTLSVADDGVGMNAVQALPHLGLGTTIVEALARQLGARVETTDGHPGSKVSIVLAA